MRLEDIKRTAALFILLVACGGEGDGPEMMMQGNAGSAGGSGAGEPVVSACTNGVVNGDFTIESTADVDRLADCTTITGNLVIGEVASGATVWVEHLESIGGDLVSANPDQSGNLHLPALTAVGGNVTIYQRCFMLDLSSLETVSGAITLTGTALLELELPSLQSAGGIELTSNISMQTVDLSSLAALDGDLTLTDAFALHELRLPVLASVSGNLRVRVTGIAALPIDLPQLTSVGGELSIDDDKQAVTSLGLGALESVGADLAIMHAPIDTFSAPVLNSITGSLILEDDDRLVEIAAPSLMSLGGLTIIANLSLSICDVQTFVEELQARGFSGPVETNNNHNEACP